MSGFQVPQALLACWFCNFSNFGQGIRGNHHLLYHHDYICSLFWSTPKHGAHHHDITYPIPIITVDTRVQQGSTGFNRVQQGSTGWVGVHFGRRDFQGSAVWTMIHWNLQLNSKRFLNSYVDIRLGRLVLVLYLLCLTNSQELLQVECSQMFLAHLSLCFRSLANSRKIVRTGQFHRGFGVGVS